MKKLFWLGLGLGLAVAAGGALMAGADAAPTRGGGIVYHRSDCGWPNVRSYAFGGAASGSSCGFLPPFIGRGNPPPGECNRAIIWADPSKNWIYDTEPTHDVPANVRNDRRVQAECYLNNRNTWPKVNVW